MKFGEVRQTEFSVQQCCRNCDAAKHNAPELRQHILPVKPGIGRLLLINNKFKGKNIVF
jgi:hypothetical protein